MPVCCYCDADLSCAACGREQPADAAQAKPDTFMDDYKRDTIAGLIERCATIAETYSDQGRDGHQIANAIRTLTLPSATRVCPKCDGEGFINRHANLPDEPCSACSVPSTQ